MQQSKHISQHSPGPAAMLAHADVKREHMKKLALVLALGSLASCGVKSNKPDSLVSIQSQSNAGGDMNFIIIEVKGHEYIVFDGYKQGGICHAESCPCKSK